MHTAKANSIYQYQNARQFLLDRVSEMQKADSSLSIRSLSKKMGMKSHALLMMLIQGKRPLRVKHSTALAQGLGLSSNERFYFQALIQYDNAQDIEEKRLCEMWLADLNPNRLESTREIQEYEIVSNWVHMAILSLSETHDFNPEPAAIAERLGSRVTTTEVRAAIERLKQFKLIRYLDDGSGKFIPSQSHVTTRDEIENLAAQKYHRDVMSLAQEALKRPLSEREFQSFAISIPRKKIALAKDLIRKFRSQFVKAIGPDYGDEVYQFGLQFFQLTERPSRIVRDEDEGVVSKANVKNGVKHVEKS